MAYAGVGLKIYIILINLYFFRSFLLYGYVIKCDGKLTAIDWLTVAFILLVCSQRERLAMTVINVLL